MNDLLGLLPARYRVDLTTGALKDRIYRNTIEWMNTFDPSEAIRSEEIMPCVSRYFSIEEKIDYCGTILHPLLHNTVGNFDWLIENFLITAVS